MSNDIDTKALVSHSLDMSAVEIVRARRTCTVPQQLLKSRELPAISNTRAVPKRYEETKPAKVQNFTHQRIMDLGELINRQERDESTKLRQLAVDKAVADTWAAAHELKMQAVKEALEKAQSQHEKELRRVSRLHERALTERALAVESRMQNKLREMIEEEKIQAASELKLALELVEEKCAVELTDAVSAARMEEQQVAHEQREQLLEEAAGTLQATKESLAAEQKRVLEDLKQSKNIERVKAVEQAKANEQEIGANALVDLQQKHSVEIQSVEEKVVAIQHEVGVRDEEIEKVQQKREQLYDELLKVQADYQSFVDRHPLFDPGQTRYLVRDIAANPNVINPYEETTKSKKKSKKSTKVI